MQISLNLLIASIIAASTAQASSIPTVVYDMADETPPDAVVGNIAESLPAEFDRNISFVLMTSKSFQYLTDFFRLTSYGDLITMKLIDRDNKNEVCGPLMCCDAIVCEIRATVLFNHFSDQSSRVPVNEITSTEQRIINLIIRINDGNDNAPQFLPSDFYKVSSSDKTRTQQPFLIYLLEGEPTTSETLPSAIDADSRPNGVVEYRLLEIAVPGQQDRKPSFLLTTQTSVYNSSMNNNETDSITPFLIQTRPLDYEDIRDRQISALLLAVDGGAPPLTGSLSLIIHLMDVNDNPPVFKHTPDELRIVIPENSTAGNRPIFIAQATDEDSGENGRVTYAISPLANAEISEKFLMDPITGEIRIRQALDYELYSDRHFTLPLIAMDAGSPQRSATASIHVVVQDVNDNVPILVVQENITVPEGEVVKKPVLKLHIKDDDEISQGQIHCDQENKTKDYQDPELLAGFKFLRLHKVSTTVFFVFTKGILDFEETPRVALVLHCVDDTKSPKFDDIFEIPQIDKDQWIRLTVAVQDLNDNAPRFIQDNYFARVPEHSPEGTFVTKVTAKDADTGEYGKLTYQLHRPSLAQAETEYRRNTASPFVIDSRTGRITVLQQSLLDRELTTKLEFQVVAKDKGGLTAVTLVEVELTDINDHTPGLLSQGEFSLIENHQPATIIGRIHFFDHDQGVNARIHMIEGAHLGLDRKKFVRMAPDPNFRYASGYAIKNNSRVQEGRMELVGDGEVRALLLSRMSIDREEVSTLYFEVIAFDEGDPVRSATVTVTLNIGDQNDNAPTLRFPTSGTVLGIYPEIHTHSPMHSHVTFLKADDPDQGENGTVVYQLQPGTNGSHLFHLNSTSGELVTQWPFRQDHDSERMRNLMRFSSDGLYPKPGIYEIYIHISDRGTPTQTTRHRFCVRINPTNYSGLETESLAFASGGTLFQSFVKHSRINKNLLVALTVFGIIILTLTTIYCLWARWLRKKSAEKLTIKPALPGANSGNVSNIAGYNDTTTASATGHQIPNELYPTLDQNSMMMLMTTRKCEQAHCKTFGQSISENVPPANLFNAFDSDYPVFMLPEPDLPSDPVMNYPQSGCYPEFSHFMESYPNRSGLMDSPKFI